MLMFVLRLTLDCKIYTVKARSTINIHRGRTRDYRDFTGVFSRISGLTESVEQ